MALTFFDILILSILTISSIIGTYKGFVTVGVNFITFSLTLVAAYFLYPIALDFFDKYLNNQLMIVIISGSISYLISLVTFNFLRIKLTEVLKGVSKGAVDRLLGLVVGVIRGLIICLALFLVIMVVASNSYRQAATAEDLIVLAINCEYPAWLKQSLTAKPLKHTLSSVISMLPANSLQSIKLLKANKHQPHGEPAAEVNVSPQYNLQQQLKKQQDLNLDAKLDNKTP